MSQRKVVVKKYCKVCKDAGKSEKEYSSHYPRESRDINSKIVCPILKALECRYCSKSGHTIKYCPKKNEKNEKNEKKNVGSNHFSGFQIEISTSNSTLNYASALKREQPIILEKKLESAPLLPRGRILDWVEFCGSDSDDE